MVPVTHLRSGLRGAGGRERHAKPAESVMLGALDITLPLAEIYADLPD